METKRILIVEDEFVTSMSIKSSLEGLGHEVVGTFMYAEDVFSRAAELKPDLIFMDIVLKGKMDGIEAAERILKELKIPLIYLTAHTGKDIFERASHTKFTDFIIKPFNESDLEKCIEKASMKRSGKDK